MSDYTQPSAFKEVDTITTNSISSGKAMSEQSEVPFSFSVSSGEVRGPLGSFKSMAGLVPYERLNQAWHSRDSEVSALTAERDAIKERVKELEEALMWCSGSDDFAPGGKARTGWEMIVGNILAKHEGEKP